MLILILPPLIIILIILIILINNKRECIWTLEANCFDSNQFSFALYDTKCKLSLYMKRQQGNACFQFFLSLSEWVR